MTRISTLIAVAMATVAASALPVVICDSPMSLPLARRFNATGVMNIIKADQARAKVLKVRVQAPHVHPVGKVFPGIDVPITNQVVIYTASIGVGTPPTTYELIIDMGFSNTWVGVDLPYVNTSSSIDTGDKVVIFYGSGFFYGEEWLNTVTLTPGLVIKNQSIGVAEYVYGFMGLDGILRFRPDDLTDGTTSGGGEIPTVTNNGFTQGLIQSRVVGISFEPMN